jgi:hypothetical protein
MNGRKKSEAGSGNTGGNGECGSAGREKIPQ